VHKIAIITAALWAAVVLGAPGELTVVWPDIEQGACMLVVGPDGTSVLVDAGTLWASRPDEDVVAWLKSLKEERSEFALRYIIATHYHQDHICWIDDVIEAELLEPDGIVYDRGGTYSKAHFEQYRSAVAPYRQTMAPGQVIELGDGAKLSCLAVAGKVYQNGSISTVDENDLSIGLLLSYQDFQLWVGGDMGARVESLVKDVVGDVDVYVVHHHGSATSSSPEFLAVLKPEVAICQVGRNTYGHPKSQIISRILTTIDTDGSYSNGTPLLILENWGAYQDNVPGVFAADPDGEGALPGTIALATNGVSYTITVPSLTEPIQLPTDGVSVTATPLPLPESTADESTSAVVENAQLGDADECVASVVLESVQLVYNQGIGDDWTLSLGINGKLFNVMPWTTSQVLTTIPVEGDTTIFVTAKAVEEDPTYDDVGTQSTAFQVHCAPSGAYFTQTLEVLVRESHGRGAGKSALWRFVVSLHVTPVKKPPSPPVLLSPGSKYPPGPTITSLMPTFRWTKVPDAERYLLTVSVFPYGDENIIYQNDNLTETSFTMPSGILTYGERYQWAVRAGNSSGWNSPTGTNLLYFQTPHAATVESRRTIVLITIIIVCLVVGIGMGVLAIFLERSQKSSKQE